MFVCAGQIVTLRYRLCLPDDTPVADGHEFFRYLHGGYGGIFPKIEQALDGQALGSTHRIPLSPADAFGPFHDDLVKVVALRDLPTPLELGMQFEADDGPPDAPQSRYKVVEIRDGFAVLDANHPFAGLDLVFIATIDYICPASADEIRQGFPINP